MKSRILNLFQRPVHPSTAVAVLILATAANLIFSYFNNRVLYSPLFLDSIFTAAAAVLLGPAGGLAAGLLTNIFMEFQYGMTGLYWPFALCNMSTGLIIGVMRNRGLFERMFHIPFVLLIVTLSNAVLGAVVALFLFRGFSGVGIDRIIMVFHNLGQSFTSAVFWTRIPVNFIDKTIAVVPAFFLNRLVCTEKPLKVQELHI